MSSTENYLSIDVIKSKFGRVVTKLGVPVCTIGGALTELTWVVHNHFFFRKRCVDVMPLHEHLKLHIMTSTIFHFEAQQHSQNYGTIHEKLTTLR